MNQNPPSSPPQPSPAAIDQLQAQASSKELALRRMQICIALEKEIQHDARIGKALGPIIETQKDKLDRLELFATQMEDRIYCLTEALREMTGAMPKEFENDAEAILEEVEKLTE